MRESLKGVRLLEVGTLTPGKYAGYLLCGWGVCSTRIERPGSDGPPSMEDLLLNKGKRSLTLNLREAAGRDLLLELAARADVVTESYRPGVAARLGIGYEAVRAVNPHVVYCSLSGFGQNGPDAGRAAYDLLFQAELGLSHLLAPAGGEPAPPRTFFADAASGLMMAFAIAAALHRKAATGEGGHIDLSVQESLFSLLSISHGTMTADGQSAGAQSEAWSRRPVYDIYPTGDGRHVALAATRAASCRALFEHLGRPDLSEVGQLPGGEGAEAADFLRRALAGKPAAAWVEELSALDIEVAPVNTPHDAFDLEQLRQRGLIVESRHPEAGDLRQIGVPAVGAVAEPLSHAPRIGADSEAILSELGYDDAAVAALRASGTI